MTKKEIFDIWAPENSIWSNWVKPIVFSQLQEKGDSATTGIGTMLRMPRSDGETILVVDLPGAAAAQWAAELARNGFRPVPMYNCAAPPPGVPAAIAVWPITNSLIRGAQELSSIPLPDNAPPAFLLDSNRRYGHDGFRPTSGIFDNRWISLPSDFPSANLLLSHGFVRAIVIQENDDHPREDLRHALLRWQKAGMRIELLAIEGSAGAREIEVMRPNLFRMAWYSALAVMGFKQSPLGGFGGMLMEYSGGAG